MFLKIRGIDTNFGNNLIVKQFYIKLQFGTVANKGFLKTFINEMNMNNL